MEEQPCQPAGTPLHALTRRDYGVAALLAGAALALYARTLAPGLLLGDSAEFQTLAATLGLAHPTGYPAYLLLGKLFTWLPVGDVAYRVNLLSACAAALALALLYLLGRRLGCRPSAALLGPLALAVCDLFWWHAVIAEVYALGAALAAAVLLLLASWRHSGDWRALAAAGLLGGLSLGVHTTVALLAPAALLYLLLAARNPRLAATTGGPRSATSTRLAHPVHVLAARRDWLAALAGASAGLALALAAFLLLDAHDAAASFYNSTARPWLSRWDLDAGGFGAPAERVAFLVSGRQFQGAVRPGSLELLAQGMRQYWSYVRAGWSPLALGLAGLGLLAGLARRATRPEALLLLLAWLTTLGFALSYAVGDVFVFYIPTYVPLAVLASLGAEALLGWANITTGLPNQPEMALSHSRRRNEGLAGSLFAVALLAGAVWPVLPAVRDSIAAGRIVFLDGTNRAAYPYPVHDPGRPHRDAARLVGAIEDNAIVFTDWGTVFTLYYVAHVEQGRTGIAAHEWLAQNGDPAASRSALRYIDANLRRRPIYFTSIPDELRGRYAFAPAGPGNLFRVVGPADVLSSARQR